MSLQQFKHVNVLRLEVGQPHPTAPNLIRNPWGVLGGWGWITPTAGTAITGYAPNVIAGFPDGTLKFTSPASTVGGSSLTFYTEPLPVLAGRYVASRIGVQTISASTSVQTRIEFLNAAGAVIGTSGTQPAVSLGTSNVTATLVPAGAVAARIGVNLIRATTGARDTYFGYAMLIQGTTSAAVTTGIGTFRAYVDSWVNIIGPTHDIKVQRSGLNVGTLNATVLDATLDPAVASTIRPGRTCRLTALVGGVWEELFTGEVREADVSYDLDAPAAKKARITLSAVDNATKLANAKRPEGVKSISDLRSVLEGCSVPWSINGDTGQQPDSAVVVSRNDNATALDQIAITRDTNSGYAWVDRKNVAQAWDATSLPTSFVTIDEDDYSDLDVSFSTSDVINSATIKNLEWDPEDSTKTIEVTYGPYEDQASIEEWGRYAREFTTHGLTAGQVATLGAAILSKNKTPSVRINSVQIPILTNADLSASKALLDLYRLVTISYAATSLNHSRRVTELEHTITSAGWLLRLGFSDDGSVATPTQAPALASTGQRPPARSTGSVFLSGPVSSVDVTYPAGRFAVIPLPICQFTTGGNVALEANVTNLSTTGFRAFIYGIGGTWSAGAVSLLWTAEEPN